MSCRISKAPAWIVGASLAILSACSSPPRGPATDPARQPPTAERPSVEASAKDQDSRYGVRDEGPLPPPADVKFEEDILDPPEESAGESFNAKSVEEENLPEEREVEPLPASVDTPIAPSVVGRQESTDPNGSPDYAIRRGFRVQLAATASRTDAERLASEAGSRLAIPVYVQSEGALHKVRAGDFIDRDQALVLRARAQSNGYPEAWVVSTEIRVPRG
jgi:cell division septation protein DedD